MAKFALIARAITKKLQEMGLKAEHKRSRDSVVIIKHPTEVDVILIFDKETIQQSWAGTYIHNQYVFDYDDPQFFDKIIKRLEKLRVFARER